MKYKPYIAVYVIFKKEDKVLLLQRANTGYQDGNYSLVSGHLIVEESLKQAAVRKAKDEAGVTVAKNDLEYCLTMHLNDSDDREYINIFHTCEKWEGDIINAQPHLCSELEWYDFENLPSNVLPHVSAALECYRNGQHYIEYGWDAFKETQRAA